MQSAAISEDDVLPYAEVFSLPLGLYLAWQLGYWFIIEVLSRLCTRYQYDCILFSYFSWKYRSLQSTFM
jgi:hypothetical protein